MADSLKQQILAKIVTEVQAVKNVANTTLFKTTGRYWPVRQILDTDEKPACFVVRIKEERPRGRGTDYEAEDIQVRDMTVGFLCIGSSGTPAALDAELCDIEARLEGKLEHNTLGGLSFPMTWLGTDTPQSSQSVPIGAVLVLFSCQYAHARGDTFNLS